MANGKPGRPAAKIDWEQVEKCGSYNMNIAQTCQMIGIAHATLYNDSERHSQFVEALERGRVNRLSRLTEKVMKHAERMMEDAETMKDPRMAYNLMLKMGDNWKDQKIEHTGHVEVEHQEQTFDDETHTRLAIEWLRQHNYDITED